MDDDLKQVVNIGIAIVILIFIVGAGIYAFDSTFLPLWMGVQRNAVENSKSYNDSRNTALTTYIQEYNALEVKVVEAKGDEMLTGVYNAQQKAILNNMCQMAVSTKEVAPNTQQFLVEHGGCR